MEQIIGNSRGHLKYASWVWSHSETCGDAVTQTQPSLWAGQCRRCSGASCHARTHSTQHREHVGLRPGGCALRALPNDAEWRFSISLDLETRIPSLRKAGLPSRCAQGCGLGGCACRACCWRAHRPLHLTATAARPAPQRPAAQIREAAITRRAPAVQPHTERGPLWHRGWRPRGWKSATGFRSSHPLTDTRVSNAVKPVGSIRTWRQPRASRARPGHAITSRCPAGGAARLQRAAMLRVRGSEAGSGEAGNEAAGSEAKRRARAAGAVRARSAAVGRAAAHVSAARAGLLSRRGAAACCLSSRASLTAERCAAPRSAERPGQGEVRSGLLYPLGPAHRGAISALLLPVGAKPRACSACRADTSAMHSGWDQSHAGVLITRFHPNKITRHSWELCRGTSSSVRCSAQTALQNGAAAKWCCSRTVLQRSPAVHAVRRASGDEQHVARVLEQSQGWAPSGRSWILGSTRDGRSAQWKGPSSLRRNTAAPLLMGGQAQWAGGPPLCWQLRSSAWLGSRRLK